MNPIQKKLEQPRWSDCLYNYGTPLFSIYLLTLDFQKKSKHTATTRSNESLKN